MFKKGLIQRLILTIAACALCSYSLAVPCEEVTAENSAEVVRQAAQAQGVPYEYAMAYHLTHVEISKNAGAECTAPDVRTGIFARDFSGDWAAFLEQEARNYGEARKQAHEQNLASIGGYSGDSTTTGASGDGTLTDGNASGEVDAGVSGDGSVGNVGGTANTNEDDGEVEIELKTIIAYLLPDPALWFERAVNIISGKSGRGYTDAGTQVNVFKMTRDASWALLFAVFVYSLVHANYYFRDNDYMEIVGRLLIAATIIAGSAGINNVIQATWLQAYKGVNAAYTDNINGKLLQATTTMLAEAPVAFAAFFGQQVASDVIGSELKVPAKVILLNGAAQATIKVIKLMLTAFAMIVVMYGIYGIAIFSSGLIMIVLMLILPLLAAMALRREFGKWLLRCVSIYISALMIVVAGPVIFSIVMDLAFGVPMAMVAEKFEEATESFEQDQAALREYNEKADDLRRAYPYEATCEVFKLLPNCPENWSVEQILGPEPPQVSSKTAGLITGMVAQYALMIVLTIVGLFMGIILMLNLERILAALFGGLAGSAGRAVLAGVGLLAMGKGFQTAAGTRNSALSKRMHGEKVALPKHLIIVSKPGGIREVKTVKGLDPVAKSVDRVSQGVKKVFKTGQGS